MVLLVLAVVRDHGAGGVVGEGVVLVRSKGDGHRTEHMQQKDEFGSRARDQHHVRDGCASNLMEQCDQSWIELDHQNVSLKTFFAIL